MVSLGVKRSIFGPHFGGFQSKCVKRKTNRIAKPVFLMFFGRVGLFWVYGIIGATFWGVKNYLLRNVRFSGSVST